MPPKKKTPLPVDKPLSRAYLREFGGWSNEYPPGMSDPTSLRIMENVMINRDGSARVRPGMRYLSYNGATPTAPMGTNPVSSHETFYLDDGRRAYLIAVREGDDTIGFRVLTYSVLGVPQILALTDAGVDFSIPGGEANLRFSSATTYVRFLQIDNKIFALSNANERMRYFEVGESKVARRLNAIERPDWTVDDKLSVVHPDAPWINAALPSTVRINRIPNPSMEYGTADWNTSSAFPGKLSRVTTVGGAHGSYALKVESEPLKINYLTEPLSDVAANGLKSWPTNGGLNVSSKTVQGDELRADITAGTVGRAAHVVSPAFDIPGSTDLAVSWASTGLGTNTWFNEVRCEFYNSGGGLISTVDKSIIPGAGANAGRYIIDSGAGSFGAPGTVTSPSNAVQMVIKPRVQVDKAGTSYFLIKDIGVGVWINGDMGADYYWEGTADESRSLYHPAQDVEVYSSIRAIGTQGDQTLSLYARGADANTIEARLRWYDISSNLLAEETGTPTAAGTADWLTRISETYSSLSDPDNRNMRAWIVVGQVARDEPVYLDSILLENASVADTYFDGDTVDTATLDNYWSGTPGNSNSYQVITLAGATTPTPEVRTADTLISSTAADNQFSFGFFYTISNQVGETAPSQVTVVKAQRAWTSWEWMAPNASGEPDSAAETSDPNACADQLVSIMPEDVFDEALVAGATKWTLYMVTWSDTDVIPASAVRIGEKQLTEASTYETDGYIAMTPQQVGALELTVPLPSMSDRFNATNPSRAGQGLVAADRMITVLDPTNAARISWSSNQQGEYTNFTPNRGGGYKTLTQGNLMVPAVVKLWQNPQSVDTLTILCMGSDGRSTGYYMAPSSVSQQSETVQIMSFEETTATPGTTSPYGVEVLNNALYHPLDDMLMKSTANNYNISHKTMTEQIRQSWSEIQDKERIVSAQLDNRLYYLVNNPAGAELEAECRGNEIWVLDTAAKEGTWSRWLIQGVSLRSIERDGYVYMSVSRPDGIYYLDPDYAVDDYVAAFAAGGVQQRNIPWYLETNTQGANRAHDAWAFLYQAELTVGNFLGTMRWGLRFTDVNGTQENFSKLLVDDGAAAEDGLPWDRGDHLGVRRIAREWYFYAGSELDDEGNVLPSQGQISHLQYRYTPSTVNTGYAFGDVETFDYARDVAGAGATDRRTESGVPRPLQDVSRP